MVDVDNKMTLWGNFCPDLPHEPLNALEILAGLRTAYHVTAKDKYIRAYHKLIDQHHYDEEAIMAKVLWPERWKTSWDDHLAAKSFYTLMRYENDPDLLRRYRMSLNRHWYDWKDRALDHPGNVFLTMLYGLLSGEDVKNDTLEAGIKGMWGFDRNRRSFAIPSP